MDNSLDLEDGEKMIQEIKGSDLEGKYLGNYVVSITLLITIIGAPIGIILLLLTALDTQKRRYFITNKRVVKQTPKIRGFEREEARYSEIEEVYSDDDEYGPWEHNKAGRIGIRLNSGELLKLDNLPDEKEVESHIKHNL